tara:strand:- start:2301 stop:3506 length:1206 start_codon:yes stop_codon:yes gene_type:complete
MKIIILNGTPFSKIWADKVNIDWYIDNGFQIEFWNFDRIYYSEKQIQRYFKNNKFLNFEPPNQKIFNNKSEVKKELYKYGNSTIYNLIDFGNHDDFWLRRALKKIDAKYYVGPRVVGFHGEKYIEKRISFKIKYFLRKLIDINKDENFFVKINPILRIKSFIYKKFNFYQKPIFVASSGKIGKEMWMDKTKAKKFLSIPSVEIEWNKKDKLIEGKYAVFIDDTIFYSPDFYMHHEGQEVRSYDIKKYKKNLNNFFYKIENLTKLKIIIAASGKFDYGDDNPYKREIFYQKTHQLIQHSDLVIGHNSSAINQAIITNQPIIMIYDQTLKEEKKLKIKYFAKYLNIKPIDIENYSIEELKKILIGKNDHSLIIKNYFSETEDFKNISMSYELIGKEIKTYFIT